MCALVAVLFSVNFEMLSIATKIVSGDNSKFQIKK